MKKNQWKAMKRKEKGKKGKKKEEMKMEIKVKKKRGGKNKAVLWEAAMQKKVTK